MDGDKKLVPFNYPLNGRLLTKLDGTMLPDAHFQTLENLRYNDGGIEGVEGMTAISAVLSGVAGSGYTKIQNGFHFKKTSPVAEDHVFVQVTNPTTGKSKVLKSVGTSAGVPALDTYEAFQTLYEEDGATESTSGRTVYFSEAPDQSMVFCDGYHNYIYSGTEYRCARFLNFAPDDSFNYDFTVPVNNSLTDDENTCTLSRVAASGADANTMLLLHLNNNLTDSSPTTPHTPVNCGWSSGSFEDNTFAALTDWTDSDAGTGASTQATYDSRSTLKATNGGTAGAGNYSLLTKDVGTLGATYTVTIVLNLDAVGALANDDCFEMSVDNGDITFLVRWCSDGLFVYDGSAWNEVGTNICVADVWQEYTFVVDSTTPASANVIVYLDDALIDATVDCSNVTTATDGLVQLRQYGSTSTDQITYVDLIKVGATQNQVVFSTDCVFGTYSASFDATEAGLKSCISIPDDGDLDLSGGTYAIDCRVKVNNLSTNQPFYYQGTDNTHYCHAYISTAGKVCLSIYDTTETLLIETPVCITADTWYHIEINESGNNYYIFVNGVLQKQTSSAVRAANYTGIAKIGKTNSTLNTQLSGKIDEFRVSNALRHSTGFVLPLAAYSTDAATHVYVGSTRPISGVKYYIETANTTAATVECYYWNGTAWTSVGTITDGTAATAGTPLAQTGTISFSSTASTANIRVIDENIAYYYYFIFTGIDATTVLSQVTLQCPVQDLVDIWDGVPRQMFSCSVYTSAYADYSENAYTLDFDATDATTYVSIGGLTSSQYIYAGFSERLTGLKVYLGGANVNTTASTFAYVDYWNGTAWTTVGTIVDGTAVGGISFARTGTVSWDAPASSSEFPTSISNSSKWYFYRIRFSATLSGTVYVDTITGIPVQTPIRPYRFPVLWQNRLFLLNDQTSNKNSAFGSSYGTNCVFNGTDAGTLTFGGSKEINCGATLFTRYGSNVYENLIVCKNNETYLVDGTSFTGDATGAGGFIVYQVSSTRGCIAPLTMKQCDTGYEVAPGVTKHILTWLASSGVVMFDSNSIIEISNDIGDRFFSYGTNVLLASMSNQSASFYDNVRGEYHLLIPVGSTATYLNEEWVYDVVRKKWFLIKRGDSKQLWCGFNTEDSYGNSYVYGGTRDGYIERLENGTTFDGNGIAYKLRLPDSLLNNSWDSRKEIRQIRLVGLCKTTTTQTVAVSHYADGSSTASVPSVVAIANNKSGRRFYKFIRSVSFIGNTHSLEFSITTTDENGGFDPLFVGGLYRVVDNDTEAA